MSFLKNLAKIGEAVVTGAVGLVDRIANYQEFEAVVAACTLVATADSKATADEMSTMMMQIAAHPQLASFKQAQVKTLVERYVTILGFDREAGAITLLEKVRAITDPAARKRILSIVEKIAAADGTTDEKETAVIERIKTA